MSTVIVTEKTTILLRYLHQQWDKKVKNRSYMYIYISFFLTDLFIPLQLNYGIKFCFYLTLNYTDT